MEKAAQKTVEELDSRRLLESYNLKEIRDDNEMASNNEEPVICRKCNITFESHGKYLQYYDEVHNSEVN